MAAKVGTGVGVAVGGLAVLLMLGIYFSRRRNSRRKKPKKRRVDVRETAQFYPRRLEFLDLERAKIRSYQKGPIELPSEPTLLRKEASRCSHEAEIRPKSPSDKSNWI